MKALFGTAGMALALAAQPVLAQDNYQETQEAETADAFAALGAMFEAEPLTAEQEARLPTARRIIDLFIPEGTFGEMMGGAVGGILGPMAEMEQDPRDALDQALGYMAPTEEMDDESVIATLDIVDPIWRDRQAAEMAAAEQMMVRMGEVMEPMMREVMTELYAIYFTQAQLEDIEAFFQTDTGTVFARESWSMSSDPRIMARMFSNEAMWEQMLDFEGLEEQLAGVAEPRNYADLQSEERARVMELTGMTEEQLRYALEPSISIPAAEAPEDAQ